MTTEAIVVITMLVPFVAIIAKIMYDIDKSIINNRKMDIAELAGKLSVPQLWIKALFEIESGNNHRAVNPHTGALGLIQFMPSTIARLGTTRFDLMKMTYNEQLLYVYQYLKPWERYYKTFTDFYLAVFFPLAIGKPNHFVLETSKIRARLIAEQNPLFDLDKDKTITRGEIETYLKKRYPGCYL